MLSNHKVWGMHLSICVIPYQLILNKPSPISNETQGSCVFQQKGSRYQSAYPIQSYVPQRTLSTS